MGCLLLGDGTKRGPLGPVKRTVINRGPLFRFHVRFPECNQPFEQSQSQTLVQYHSQGTHVVHLCIANICGIAKREQLVSTLASDSDSKPHYIIRPLSRTSLFTPAALNTQSKREDALSTKQTMNAGSLTISYLNPNMVNMAPYTISSITLFRIISSLKADSRTAPRLRPSSARTWSPAMAYQRTKLKFSVVEV